MPAPSRGETLDRVVAAVGNTAVTASDVEREYRLELFLEGKRPAGSDPDAATLNEVRERVIDRILLEQSVESNGISVAPDSQEVDQRLDEVRQKFPNRQAFEAGLQALGLGEGGLRQKLAEEEEILQFVDQRFRPLAAVDASEIEAYYRGTLLPELGRDGQAHPPPLADVQDRIREILLQRKIDGLLADWLKRLRASRDVRVYGSAEADGKP